MKPRPFAAAVSGCKYVQMWADNGGVRLTQRRRYCWNNGAVTSVSTPSIVPNIGYIANAAGWEWEGILDSGSGYGPATTTVGNSRVYSSRGSHNWWYQGWFRLTPIRVGLSIKQWKPVVSILAYGNGTELCWASGLNGWYSCHWWN